MHRTVLGSDNPYFGCTVGRVANRICKGEFQLDGKSFTLADRLLSGHFCLYPAQKFATTRRRCSHVCMVFFSTAVTSLERSTTVPITSTEGSGALIRCRLTSSFVAHWLAARVDGVVRNVKGLLLGALGERDC
jgi:hypothetical protein